MDYRIRKNFIALDDYIANGGKSIDKNLVYKGKPLGSWFWNNVRKYIKGKLSDELVDLFMERECFKLAVEEMANPPRRTRATWEENYATLSNKVQNNEFIVKDNLYKWYLHQLKRKDLDSDKAEKIKELHSLFKFKDNSDIIWNDHYNQLVDYYHKNNILPKRSTVYEDFNLGAWFSTQKNEYTAGHLSDKRVKLIKPYFEIMATKKAEAWEKNYLQLKAIADNNGKLFVGTNLYRWYVRQLTNYSKLTKEQEEKLKSLRIELSQAVTIDKHRADVWVEKLNLVKEYINLENKVIIRATKYKGIYIGKWLQLQKDNLYKNNLSVQQKESFKKFLDEYDEYIGVGFPQGYDEWHYNYKVLSEFVFEKGRLPKKSESKKLYNWINLQKFYKKKGYLSDDKWELLSNLGVSELQSDKELSEKPKTLTDKTWEKNFNLCMEHYTEKGSFPVYDCIYKDVRVGFWLSKQRQRYRQGNLLPERIEKMKSVGMI